MNITNITADCPPENQPGQINISEPNILTTPGYSDGKYPPNQNCNFVIKASNSSNRIQAKISSSQLEDRLFSGCDDFLEIRDGIVEEFIHFYTVF